VEDELYRIGQEAITNAFKHSAATKIEARLCYRASTVVLTISDDGRGFDPESQGDAGAAEHFGLLGMRERAARIGGALTIRRALETGTVIEVVVTHPEDQRG
jgi:signal transduction histidine kinase